MVITEQINGFCIHKSDTYMIQKIGTDEVYSEAYDILPCNHDYVETEELLPVKSAKSETRPRINELEILTNQP